MAEFSPSLLSVPPLLVFHSDIVAPLTVVTSALLLLLSCGGRMNCSRAILPAQLPLFPGCLPYTPHDDLIPTVAVSNGHLIEIYARSGLFICEMFQLNHQLNN